MQQQKANDLVKKYLAGDCTEEEIAMLETWYLNQGKKGLPEISQERKETQLDEVWNTLSRTVDIPVASKPLSFTPRLWAWSAAAMLVMALGVGLYLYKAPETKPSVALREAASPKPGTNTAILTLADGRTLTLDEAKNGKIADQSGIIITKTKDGELIYAGETAVTAMNKISTPNGGQYQITLPDGTKVWLNAASSLSYPTAFTGNRREVTLTGEAYFEVAKNKVAPFMVYTEGQEIKVLGTYFNVNSYGDEKQTKTTLLEGSVSVRSSLSDRTALLKPGQQAILDIERLNVEETDVEEAVAWKDGYFLFQDEDIWAIMRQISRWYDVEVVYDANVSRKKIGGNISRRKSLAAVLKTLASTEKFNFKVEGRRVTVMP